LWRHIDGGYSGRFSEFFDELTRLAGMKKLQPKFIRFAYQRFSWASTKATLSALPGLAFGKIYFRAIGPGRRANNFFWDLASRGECETVSDVLWAWVL
jgi:hypothetical protein